MMSDWVEETHDKMEKLGGVANILSEMLGNLPGASDLDKMIEEDARLGIKLGDMAETMDFVDTKLMIIDKQLKYVKNEVDRLMEVIIWNGDLPRFPEGETEK